jgi:hypothetical protein
MKLLVATPTLTPEKYVKPPLLLPDDYEWLLLDNHETNYPIQDLATARNQALEYARKNRFTHLLMLDSDLVPPRNVFDLLNDYPGDIVCGSYIEKRRFQRSMFCGLFTVPLTITTSNIACGLIKTRPLYDVRLDFSIDNLQYSDDGNFRLKVDSLGYETAICPGALCEHRYKESLDFNEEDRKIFSVIANCLILMFPERAFWPTQKIIQKRDLLNLTLKFSFPKKYIKYKSKRIFALQTGRNEYAILSGFEEAEPLKDSVDVSVLTPTAPRQFSEYELFKLIGTVNMMG